MQEQEVQTKAPEEFNPQVVHVRDPKTNRIVQVNAYRLHIMDGVHYYEYPKYSGNLWFGNGEPAGRVERDKENGGFELMKKAAHKAWVPPVTPVQAEQQRVNDVMSENAALKAELAAIKKEQEAPKRKINTPKTPKE